MSIEPKKQTIQERADIDQYISQLESQVQQSEARYHQLYRNTPVMMQSIDRNGILIEVSNYWLQALGYERNDVIGHPFTEFLTASTRQHVNEVDIPSFFIPGAITSFSYQLVCKDNTIRDVHLSVIAEDDDSGHINHARIVMVDMTETNQTAINLRHYQGRLETLVDTRTTELIAANKQLQAEVLERQQAEQELAYQAQALRQSNEDLEEFAYVVSHDLQEPLRAMTAFSQLLEQRYGQQLDASAKRYIGHIVDGGTRMKAMIDGILDLSRITNKTSENSSTNLEEALEIVLENLKLICLETQVTITHDALPTLQIDQNHIVQLLQNLIANAIKFRGPNPPQIHIAAKQHPDKWVFSVKDNGIGIAQDQQERIFKLFQRLHNQQEHKGYGIGLAICKKIVERYQGEIWIQSSLGKGAIFYFTIGITSHG